MSKRKLSEKQIADLRADYEAWNPFDEGSESVAELAARHGISKQTLYNYRDQWAAGEPRRSPTSADLAATVTYLTGELVAAKTRILKLEDLLRQNDIDPAT